MLRRAFTLGALLAATVVSVEAQWLSHRDPTTPRTADGKPNLTAPAPRFNGRPDLSGVWEAERTSADEFVKLYHLPKEAVLGYRETLYPEYRKKIKDSYVPPPPCTESCGAAGNFVLRR